MGRSIDERIDVHSGRLYNVCVSTIYEGTSDNPQVSSRNIDLLRRYIEEKFIHCYNFMESIGLASVRMSGKQTLELFEAGENFVESIIIGDEEIFRGAIEMH